MSKIAKIFKSKKFIIISLSIILFLSAALTAVAIILKKAVPDVPQTEEAPEDYAYITYKDLVEFYAPTEEEKSIVITDYVGVTSKEDAYKAFKLAYSGLLAEKKVYSYTTGQTEAGATVNIKNTKKLEDNYFYMRMESKGSSSLLSAITDKDTVHKMYIDEDPSKTMTKVINNLKGIEEDPMWEKD